jgi:prophage regulatory protein
VQELLNTCPADHVSMDKPIALIREPVVKARTGVSRSTRHELMAADLFPRPVKIAGTRSVAWVESEVDAWIKAQIEAARGIANP